jgi:hypothetical protein
MIYYKGYYNYYIGDILKNYHFDGYSLLLCKLMRELIKLRCTRYIGEMICEVRINANKTEQLQIINLNSELKAIEKLSVLDLA